MIKYMLNAKELPEIKVFEDLISEPENALVKQAVAAGRKPIGYNCYITPEPLMMVGGMFPVRLRAPGLRDTVQSNYYMSLIACTYARSILETIINGKYDFLRGIISGGSCVQLIRTAQHVDYISPYQEKIKNGELAYYVLDSPRKVSDGTMDLYLQDIKRAAAKLSEVLDVDYSDDALRAAIRELNEHHALLKRISDFRKGPEPKITGTEYHKVMVASMSCPKDLLKQPMEDLIAALERREPVTGYKARLMIVGPIFDNPEYTQLIEDQDTLVVCDRYCHGSIPGLEPIPEEGDPWVNLADYYADTCECTRMMGWIDRRHAKNLEYIKEFDVDGVIMHYIKFCDLWSYEEPMAVKMFHEEGIPAVKIEHEYSFSNEGQIKTRVQAFVEQMENSAYMK